MKRGKPMVLVLAAGVFAAALFAWQQGWPPRPALGWLQRLQPEEVTQMELVYMPQAPEERYHLLKAEEIPAAVEFFNTAHGRYLASPEPVAGGGVSVYLTLQDGSRHTVTNDGNQYLFVDGECYLPGYDWLSRWKDSLPQTDEPLPEDFVW